MSPRINTLLPDQTLVALGRRSLRERLKAGYLANAGENLKVAAEWFPVEEEAWRTSLVRSRRRPRNQEDPAHD